MVAPGRLADFGTGLERFCFVYPTEADGRRHGPSGYTDLESLRDEFAFRCAYCLMRESWLRGGRGFQIDHFRPRFQEPALLLDYDNLVYTCPWCNQAKAGLPVPDPTKFPYGSVLRVGSDGTIQSASPVGRVLIRGLQLDHPDLTAQRKLIIATVRLAESKGNQTFIRRLLGFPDDLPNLIRKRPPTGNSRKDGVNTSYFALSQRGELPPVY